MAITLRRSLHVASHSVTEAGFNSVGQSASVTSGRQGGMNKKQYSWTNRVGPQAKFANRPE